MKAVFFDRDGIVNKDFGYVYKQEDFIFLDGIFEVLKFCKKQHYLLILVTNQSGIGMGYYTLEDFQELSYFMQAELRKKIGFDFDSVYFCPHAPNENCSCRKPKAGMIEKAIKEFKINVTQSILIGDRVRDIQAADKAGVKYKILLTKHNYQEKIPQMQNLYTITYLKQAIDIIQEKV